MLYIESSSRGNCPFITNLLRCNFHLTIKDNEDDDDINEEYKEWLK